MIPSEVREQIEALRDRDPPRYGPIQAASRVAWNGALQKVIAILDEHDAAHPVSETQAERRADELAFALRATKDTI